MRASLDVGWSHVVAGVISRVIVKTITLETPLRWRADVPTSSNTQSELTLERYNSRLLVSIIGRNDIRKVLNSNRQSASPIPLPQPRPGEDFEAMLTGMQRPCMERLQVLSKFARETFAIVYTEISIKAKSTT